MSLYVLTAQTAQMITVTEKVERVGKGMITQALRKRERQSNTTQDLR